MAAEILSARLLVTLTLSPVQCALRLLNWISSVDSHTLTARWIIKTKSLEIQYELHRFGLLILVLQDIPVLGAKHVTEEFAGERKRRCGADW